MCSVSKTWHAPSHSQTNADTSNNTTRSHARMRFRHRLSRRWLDSDLLTHTGRVGLRRCDHRLDRQHNDRPVRRHEGHWYSQSVVRGRRCGHGRFQARRRPLVRARVRNATSSILARVASSMTPSTLWFPHRDYKVEQLVKSGNLEGAAAASAANAKA